MYSILLDSIPSSYTSITYILLMLSLLMQLDSGFTVLYENQKLF